METMLERADLIIHECCNGLVGRAAAHQAELNQEIAQKKKHQKDKGRHRLVDKLQHFPHASTHLFTQ